MRSASEAPSQEFSSAVSGDNTLSDNGSKVWLGVVGLAFVILLAPARSEDSSNGGCPISFILMGAVCLNETTGDVVNPTSSSQTVAVKSPVCQTSYELIQSVCISRLTGDVELPAFIDGPSSNQAKQ